MQNESRPKVYIIRLESGELIREAYAKNVLPGEKPVLKCHHHYWSLPVCLLAEELIGKKHAGWNMLEVLCLV